MEEENPFECRRRLNRSDDEQGPTENQEVEDEVDEDDGFNEIMDATVEPPPRQAMTIVPIDLSPEDRVPEESMERIWHAVGWADQSI